MVGSDDIYDDSDPYEDLPGFRLDEEITQLQGHNQQLEEKLKDVMETNNGLVKVQTSLEEQNKNLNENMSTLLKTAKTEIQRKDKVIDDLRNQIDNLSKKFDQFIQTQQDKPKPTAGERAHQRESCLRSRDRHNRSPSDDRIRLVSGDRGRPNSRDRCSSISRSGDRGRPNSRDRVSPRSRERVRSRSGDRCRPTSRDHGSPRSSDRGRPRPNERVRSRSGDRGSPRSRERVRSRSGDRCRPYSRDRVNPNARNRLISVERGRQNPRDHGGPRSGDRGRLTPRDHPRHRTVSRSGGDRGVSKFVKPDRQFINDGDRSRYEDQRSREVNLGSREERVYRRSKSNNRDKLEESTSLSRKRKNSSDDDDFKKKRCRDDSGMGELRIREEERRLEKRTDELKTRELKKEGEERSFREPNIRSPVLQQKLLDMANSNQPGNEFGQYTMHHHDIVSHRVKTDGPSKSPESSPVVYGSVLKEEITIQKSLKKEERKPKVQEDVCVKQSDARLKTKTPIMHPVEAFIDSLLDFDSNRTDSFNETKSYKIPKKKEVKTLYTLRMEQKNLIIKAELEASKLKQRKFLDCKQVESVKKDSKVENEPNLIVEKQKISLTEYLSKKSQNVESAVEMRINNEDAVVSNEPLFMEMSELSEPSSKLSSEMKNICERNSRSYIKQQRKSSTSVDKTEEKDLSEASNVEKEDVIEEKTLSMTHEPKKPDQCGSVVEMNKFALSGTKLEQKSASETFENKPIRLSVEKRETPDKFVKLSELEEEAKVKKKTQSEKVLESRKFKSAEPEVGKESENSTEGVNKSRELRSKKPEKSQLKNVEIKKEQFVNINSLFNENKSSKAGVEKSEMGSESGTKMLSKHRSSKNSDIKSSTGSKSSVVKGSSRPHREQKQESKTSDEKHKKTGERENISKAKNFECSGKILGEDKVIAVHEKSEDVNETSVENATKKLSIHKSNVSSQRRTSNESEDYGVLNKTTEAKYIRERGSKSSSKFEKLIERRRKRSGKREINPEAQESNEVLKLVEDATKSPVDKNEGATEDTNRKLEKKSDDLMQQENNGKTNREIGLLNEAQKDKSVEKNLNESVSKRSESKSDKSRVHSSKRRTISDQKSEELKDSPKVRTGEENFESKSVDVAVSETTGKCELNKTHDRKRRSGAKSEERQEVKTTEHSSKPRTSEKCESKISRKSQEASNLQTINEPKLADGMDERQEVKTTKHSAEARTSEKHESMRSRRSQEVSNLRSIIEPKLAESMDERQKIETIEPNVEPRISEKCEPKKSQETSCQKKTLKVPKMPDTLYEHQEVEKISEPMSSNRKHELKKSDNSREHRSKVSSHMKKVIEEKVSDSLKESPLGVDTGKKENTIETSSLKTEQTLKLEKNEAGKSDTVIKEVQRSARNPTSRNKKSDKKTVEETNVVEYEKKSDAKSPVQKKIKLIEPIASNEGDRNETEVGFKPNISSILSGTNKKSGEIALYLLQALHSEGNSATEQKLLSLLGELSEINVKKPEVQEETRISMPLEEDVDLGEEIIIQVEDKILKIVKETKRRTKVFRSNFYVRLVAKRARLHKLRKVPKCGSKREVMSLTSGRKEEENIEVISYRKRIESVIAKLTEGCHEEDVKMEKSQDEVLETKNQDMPIDENDVREEYVDQNMEKVKEENFGNKTEMVHVEELKKQEHNFEDVSEDAEREEGEVTEEEETAITNKYQKKRNLIWGSHGTDARRIGQYYDVGRFGAAGQMSWPEGGNRNLNYAGIEVKNRNYDDRRIFDRRVEQIRSDERSKLCRGGNNERNNRFEVQREVEKRDFGTKNRTSNGRRSPDRRRTEAFRNDKNNWEHHVKKDDRISRPATSSNSRHSKGSCLEVDRYKNNDVKCTLDVKEKSREGNRSSKRSSSQDKAERHKKDARSSKDTFRSSEKQKLTDQLPRKQSAEELHVRPINKAARSTSPKVNDRKRHRDEKITDKREIERKKTGKDEHKEDYGNQSTESSSKVYRDDRRSSYQKTEREENRNRNEDLNLKENLIDRGLSDKIERKRSDRENKTDFKNDEKQSIKNDVTILQNNQSQNLFDFEKDKIKTPGKDVNLAEDFLISSSDDSDSDTDTSFLINCMTHLNHLRSTS